MSLNIIRGKQDVPFSILLYGPEGIGKSSFAAGAPSPLFIDAEGGTTHLDVARVHPRSWADIRTFITSLGQDTQGFKTLVIDTLDWVEQLIWQHVCARDKKQDIEAYGYGKGYVTAMQEWRGLVADLERMQAATKMNVILLAHSHIKAYQNPEGENFDRYQLKLNDKAAGLVKEWPDAVLFANYQQFTKKDGAKAKGFSTGERYVYSVRTATYDAKNRYGLPETMPLSWAEFAKFARPQATKDLLNEITKLGEEMQPLEDRLMIQQLADRMDPGVRKECLAALDRAGTDNDKLSKLYHWATSQVAERQTA